MNHSVTVLDMFDYMNEEANSVVTGFESAELAIEYARRRTRASVEEQRSPNIEPEVLKSLWFSFGEDCLAEGYIGGREVDYFIANPAPKDTHPELTDWAALEPKKRNDVLKPKMNRDIDIDPESEEAWRYGPPYSWNEIEEYLQNKERRPYGHFRPGGSPLLCEFCGKRTKRIWWSSRDETWDSLCGRAGDLEICIKCKAWYPAEVTIIN